MLARLATLTLALTFFGCGESGAPRFDRAAVRGTVTADGEPLSDGTIRFVPTEPGQGQMVFTRIQQGSYALPAESGPPLGRVRVEITAMRKTGETETVDGETREIEDQYIPAQYNVASGLMVQIEPGENEHNIVLNLQAP